MILCDASPLVALINKKDENHQTCVDALSSLPKPLVTTSPCFTETLYLLGKRDGWHAQNTLWKFHRRGILHVHFLDNTQLDRAHGLMAQYKDVPMDFGDASLVAAAEVLEQRQIFTLDKDFYIYRLLENQAFEVIPGPA